MGAILFFVSLQIGIVHLSEKIIFDDIESGFFIVILIYSRYKNTPTELAGVSTYDPTIFIPHTGQR